VRFTPTIPHCAMATLIGLAIRVKLVRSLHPKIKVRPPIPSNVPPTYSAPLIPRAQTYLVPLDDLYLGEFTSVVRAAVKQKDEKKSVSVLRAAASSHLAFGSVVSGGPHAHQWFTAPPKLDLMFLHEWDDHNHNYTEQQFTIVGSSRGVDAQYGWEFEAVEEGKGRST
ncbi:hypothetical protein NECAME_17583, partial [Necator americanus]